MDAQQASEDGHHVFERSCCLGHSCSLISVVLLARETYGQPLARQNAPATDGVYSAGLTAQPPSYTELLDSVQQLKRRLDANEAQLGQLKSRDAEREAWEASVMERLPRVDSPWTTVSVSHDRRAAGEQADCRQACEPKPACPGVPGFCADCLEKLGWNKAGGWRIVPFGRLRGEMIYSTAPQTGDAVIAFLNPNVPGIDEDQFTVHARQSQLNFALSRPSRASWETGGVFAMNFMGSQPLRNFSGANIVLAYGEIKNDNWRFAFGRMLDLFSPINPATVNQLNQRGAGNIGIYRGAFHVDRYLTVSDTHKWTISCRAAQQDISDYAGVPGIRGKDNGWPNIEGRIGWELGPMRDYGRPFEIGLSGVLGETQAVADPLVDFGQGLIFPGIDDVAQTRGACLDLQLQGSRIGFRGETWWGQAAGTYFVATLQSLNPQTAQAIESVGGWGAVYFNISPCLTTRVGYGVDDPRNVNLGFLDPINGVGQISYNEVAWWNMIWNATDYFDVEFEVSHRRTHFLVASAANEGTLFHFASTLKF